MKPLALILALAATPALADDFMQFQSPTGNIHCLIATGDYAEARCDMIELTPTYRQPPPDCDLDWGSAFTVGLASRQGQLACVGDTAINPDSIVLGYGKTLSLGGFDCTSEKTGMTCTNPGGHGFTLSKAKQRLY
ncbi:MAG: DUF6636 domain-containing protein [Paracoccaceae bacterium]